MCVWEMILNLNLWPVNNVAAAMYGQLLNIRSALGVETRRRENEFSWGYNGIG